MMHLHHRLPGSILCVQNTGFQHQEEIQPVTKHQHARDKHQGTIFPLRIISQQYQRMVVKVEHDVEINSTVY
jgi:hypothetical protein